MQQEKQDLLARIQVLKENNTCMQQVNDMLASKAKSLEEQVESMLQGPWFNLVRQERLKQRQAKLEQSKPALLFYQEMFSMQIIPIQPGEIKIVMTHIHPKEWEKEYWFIIEIDQTFSVQHCYPPLENMAQLVSLFNESTDLYQFLKMVRQGFVNSAKSE